MNSELTVEFAVSQARWIATALLFVCLACLIDFNDLRRLQRRTQAQALADQLHFDRLDEAVKTLIHDRRPDVKAPAPARPRPARKGAAAKTAGE